MVNRTERLFRPPVFQTSEKRRDRNEAKLSKITQRCVFTLLFSDMSIEINHFLQTFYLIFHSAAAMLETHPHVAAFTRVQNVCWKASFTPLTFVLSVISVVDSAPWYQHKHLPPRGDAGFYVPKKTLANKNSSERTLPKNKGCMFFPFLFAEESTHNAGDWISPCFIFICSHRIFTEE